MKNSYPNIYLFYSQSIRSQHQTMQMRDPYFYIYTILKRVVILSYRQHSHHVNMPIIYYGCIQCNIAHQELSRNILLHVLFAHAKKSSPYHGSLSLAQNFISSMQNVSKLMRNFANFSMIYIFFSL